VAPVTTSEVRELEASKVVSGGTRLLLLLLLLPLLVLKLVAVLLLLLRLFKPKTTEWGRLVSTAAVTSCGTNSQHQ
jgi:hypothetical protein